MNATPTISIMSFASKWLDFSKSTLERLSPLNLGERFREHSVSLSINRAQALEDAYCSNDFRGVAFDHSLDPHHHAEANMARSIGPTN
jgi:hypothetical protein